MELRKEPSKVLLVDFHATSCLCLVFGVASQALLFQLASNISLEIIKVEILEALHIKFSDDEGVVCSAFIFGARLQLLCIE